SPTFRLAGDEPVTLIGTVINPTSDQDAGRQLRTFRIETSLDGVTYQPVLEAGLSAARVDQAFEFESPVTARFARLVGLDADGGGSPSYLGEWKLIADDPALFSGLDLALPELGGNVVWSRPLLGSGDHIDVLSVTDNVGVLDLRDHEDFTFAIGFDNARAALIRSLQWLQVDEEAERLFETVEV